MYNKRLFQHINDLYSYVNELRMPILYEYLQRNRGRKRPSMAEVVRYINAYYKTFSKLTEERHPGRKFFDHLFEQ
jgi:hypothetical protein